MTANLVYQFLGGPAADTMGGLVEQYRILTGIAEDLSAATATIRGRISEELERMGVESARTEHGTAYIQRGDPAARVDDESAFTKWLTVNYPGLVVERPHPQALKQLPGIILELDQVLAADVDGERVAVPGLSVRASGGHLVIRVAKADAPEPDEVA